MRKEEKNKKQILEEGSEIKPKANTNMRYPVNFIAISQDLHQGKCLDFGWNSNHGGKNVAIYSCAAGTVKIVRTQSGGGQQIFIDHGNDITSGYSHLSKQLVKVGDKVYMGQQIGNMGATGSLASGEHLHFSLLKTSSGNLDSGYYNPFDYLEVYDDQEVGSTTLQNYGKRIRYYEPVEPNPLYTRYVYKVDDNGLNVYNTPDGIKIASIGFGTPVYVYEVLGNWSRVGRTKWVQTAFLSSSEPSAYIVDAPLGANVYNQPSTSGKILRTLKTGSLVGIYKTSGSWVKVSPSAERWVQKDYLAGICPNPYPYSTKVSLGKEE